MCPFKIDFISWLWTPLRIFNLQSFVFLLRYPQSMNIHPHFLESVASCFNLFFGNLSSPLLSHTSCNIGLITFDLRITMVNSALFAWRRTQLSNSSVSFQLTSSNKKLSRLDLVASSGTTPEVWHLRDFWQKLVLSHPDHHPRTQP